MTKNSIDETTLRPHLNLDDASTIIESTTELVCNETLAIYKPVAKPVRKRSPKAIHTSIKINTRRSKVSKIMCELYDLEQNGTPERALHIDLDLYQMEKY
ncbi:MAG: hypothetical protein QXU99_07880 [Candidatus Bathyarchaeia archaeon]